MGTSKQSVLIAEDTPMHLHSLVRILQPHYNLIVATGGQKALELAEKYEVDLILLDVLMDGKSGFDVLKELKASKKTTSIPVIFITALDEVESEITGLTEGAVDYITKPFKDEIVLLRIHTQMKLIKQMRQLEESTKIDSLTGICNRHTFNLDINQAWEHAIDNGLCISLIMLDIDRFKSFNDTYGHLSGDVCLTTIANALKASVSDTVYRWGGEEFAVLLPNTSLANAQAIAERLRKTAENTPVEHRAGHFTSVTISLGVATIYPTEKDNLTNFCDEADKALYRAKQSGRNRVEAALLLE
ncbi:MAG: diguanylate cyclase [Spirochaetes bacterium]|nr:diguanylate cyclase [Spirochaetota bacterium]